MEELLKNLPTDEISFLTENDFLIKQFYYQLCEIKQKSEEKVILCDNSYERRIVHILAYALGLYHARHGAWDKTYEKNFDWQCKCKLCWEDAGEKYFRIIGVKVSTNPLPLSNKDVTHQKMLHKIEHEKNKHA